MRTCLEKLSRANRWRIRVGSKLPINIPPKFAADWGTDEIDGWNGHFLVPLEGDLWHVILSDGMGWRHLSVTNAQRLVLPSWNIMCRLKESFFGDDAWVVQFHPAKEDNINDHPYCLHLWESLDEKFPVPPIVTV